MKHVLVFFTILLSLNKNINAQGAGSILLDEMIAPIEGSLQIEAGFNISNISVKYNKIRPNAKSIPGFNIGLVLDLPSKGKVSTELGLLMSTSGATYNVSETINYRDSNNVSVTYSYDLDQKITNYNFIFPLKIKYKFGPENMKFYWSGGLYFGAGLEGKIESKGSYIETYPTGNIISGTFNDNIKIQYQSDPIPFNRYDIGFLFGTGIEFSNQFLLSATYDFGLLNQANSDYYSNEEISFKNRVVRISIGYRFNS